MEELIIPEDGIVVKTKQGRVSALIVMEQVKTRKVILVILPTELENRVISENKRKLQDLQDNYTSCYFKKSLITNIFQNRTNIT